METAPEKQAEQTPAADLMVSPRRALLRAYRGEVVFGVSLVLCAVMAVLANRYAYFSWDVGIAAGIQLINIPGFNWLMIWVSKLGNGWVPFSLVTATCIGLLLARFRVEALICAAGVAAGAGLNRLFKAVVDRPRPSEPLVQVMFDVNHESFPSGHVVFFVEFFGFLFFLTFVLLKPGLLRRVALVFFGALLALVGISRIYLGAHWPSDVCGAYLAGGLWLMLMTEGYRRLKSKEEGPA